MLGNLLPSLSTPPQQLDPLRLARHDSVFSSIRDYARIYGSNESESDAESRGEEEDPADFNIFSAITETSPLLPIFAADLGAFQPFIIFPTRLPTVR